MHSELKFVAILLVLAKLLLPSVALGKMSHLVAKSQTDSVGTAFTPNGIVSIDLREVQTEVSRADGPALLSVLIIFEPKSGSFSWRATLAGDTPSWRISQFNDGQAAFLRGGTTVDFRALGGPSRLFLHAYRNHALNMKEAEAKALEAASTSISFHGDLDNGQDVIVICLLDLGFDFINSPMSAAANVTPKIIDVRWDAALQHCVVTVQARWKAEITLDAKYALVSMRKVE